MDADIKNDDYVDCLIDAGNRIADWNTNADALHQACGAFVDAPHSKQTTGDNL